MKKFMNDPHSYVEDYLKGILSAHGDLYTLSEENERALCLKHPTPGKVAIVTGGGSGHLPLFLGYVGHGLADACAVGNVFASPSCFAMVEAARAVDTGAGVLYLFGNYGGDRMNFDMAAEELSDDGVAVEQVWCNDDVASAPPEKAESRRGVAGILFAYKCAGAAAKRMLPLEEVTRIARKTVANVRSMGVALSACTLPEIGHPSFTIEEDEMELGMGIHGEPGIERGKIMSADQVAQVLTDHVLGDMDYPAGSRVAVLINLLGATALEEGYIVYGKVHELLKAKGLEPVKVLVGEYSTSMEMAGLSLSVLKLDEELESLLNDEAHSPFVKFEKDWR